MVYFPFLSFSFLLLFLINIIISGVIATIEEITIMTIQ